MIPANLLASIASSVLSEHFPFPNYAGSLTHNTDHNVHILAKRHEEDESGGQRAIFIILIPILVVLSGIFAGLTLGYMSLDTTQLQILSLSGTP